MVALMSEDDLRREEVRGLFALGLVAVAVALRYTSGLATTIQAGYLSNIPILSILDGVILLWGLYAFFMVFAFSRDILPKSLCDTFRGLAKYCLLVSLIFLTFIAILVGIANITVLVWLLVAASCISLGIKGIEIIYRKKKVQNKSISLPTSSPVPAYVQLLEEFREKARKNI